ncbi:hypothetical protein [Vibrio parahaemolyticus]|uniref:hypothetical protein n=1 Tax=Vibrio parahaemolyticus TaxID=670 RepID=UPI0023628EB7|nr:hypothetical protein [Vibrio parahaemolyticus]
MTGKINPISVYFSWFFLALTFIVFAFAMLNFHDSESAIVVCFTVFIFFSFVHLILACFVRCPHCNKCITIQDINEPHPMSDGSWSKTVIKWFSGYVRCINCGNGVKTNGI